MLLQLLHQIVGQPARCGLKMSEGTGAIRAAQDGAEIGEIDVDHPRLGNQADDAADTLMQIVVNQLEALRQRGVIRDQRHDFLVRHDNHAIRFAAQLMQTVGRELAATAAFEVKGQRHDGEDQRTEFAAKAGDDRCRAGAGPAAHAGHDIDQVHAGERGAQSIEGIFGRQPTPLGIASRPHAPHQSIAQQHPVAHLDGGQRLRVGIGGDDPRFPHPGALEIGGQVATGAADADHELFQRPGSQG